MPLPLASSERVRFGQFDFDRRTLELRHAGRPVRLERQPAQVLSTLLSKAGELVTREELQQEIWSRDTFVDFEAGLNYCLGHLRATLGDAASHPTFIETLRGRGYRFVSPVERVGGNVRTIAVLPFDNIGGDVSQEFVADGVADGLITELGKIGALRVISRQSVLAFKGSTLAMPEIARRLRADTVLEGSVLRHGDRLRITAQLIEVEPERHLWAESYDGDPREFMDVLVRVARAVAGAISVVLVPEDEARLAPANAEQRRSYRPDAQTAYLKARFHLGKWSGADFEQGVRLLHETIAIDPSHAPAHASLASCLSLLGYNGMAPARVVYPQAKAAAQRAVDLDPQSSYGHTSLGFVKLVYDWDFEGASACFERAIETGPNNEDALLTHAMYLLWVRGEKPRALAEVRAALAIDPVSPFTNSMAPWVTLMAYEWDEAARLAEHALTMYPDAPQPATALAWTHVARGRLAEATALFEAVASKSSDPMTQGFLGHVYGLAGRTDDARRILDRLKKADPTGHTCAKSIVAVLAGIGDLDGAFAWMDRGIAERDGGLLSLRASPPFLPLAGDPRFETAARKMGLPPRS